jgi:PAS domain S-box-containing protein
MRIKTQFLITMFLFGLILVVMAVSAVITSQQMRKASAQEKIASDIAQGANELSYLANDYLIYRESQQLSRWQSRFTSFSTEVAGLDVDKSDQQALVRNIQANTRRLREVFDSVATAVGNSPKTGEGALDSAFLQVSWSRMAVQSQGLVSDASRLSQLLHQQMDQLRETRAILMYFMVCLFGLFLVASYMLTHRRILKSILTLQARAAVIGSGNLDFTLEEKKNDEIGDLSHAFNQMTTNLKAVTASKADLEKEVAQRKQAEEDLRRQREWLRVTLSSIGDAVIASDMEGRITFLNPVAVTLTGWRTGEALRQPVQNVFRIINEKTREPAGDLVAQVLSEKRVIGLANDTALITKDGREVPIEDSAAPILDAAGKATGVVLVFHDVTQKRRAQEALREAHDRAAWLARFPEQNPNPVIRTSADGTVLYCNPVSAKLGGWKCEVGQVLQDELLPLVDRAMAEGREVQEDVPLAGRFYVVWITPFLKEGYVNVYGRDITERKQAEEALRQSEERLRLAQEAAHVGVWDWNPVTQESRWTPELETIYGLKPGSVRTYQDFTIRVHPDDIKMVEAKRDEAVAQQKTFEFEFRIQRPQGDTGWIHCRGGALYDQAGRPTRIFGVNIDITERKRAEEALKQRTTELQQLTQTLEHRVQERTGELEKANEALRYLSSKLLSVQEDERKRIADELHDSVASSFGAIIFSIEKIIGQEGQDESTRAGLRELIARVRHVNEETRRIMSDLRPSLLDDLGIAPALNWFCREYEKIYSHIRVEKEIDLSERDLADSLKTAIYRICQEAMNNIAKHSQANLVSLKLQEKDGRIELTIQDDGRGFDLDTVRRGLGLSTMKERAQHSGGSFDLESGIGKGTKIRLSWRR